MHDGAGIPNVEQLECIEQHPFLHVVINLLIGPKARSSIDLPEKTGEKLSKNNWVFSALCHFFFTFILIQKSKIASECFTREGHRCKDKKREAEMGREGLCSLSRKHGHF